MSEDGELELWKRRRLLEMQRKLLIKKVEEEKKEQTQKQKPQEPKELLKRLFVGRALEVWNAAERQYPTLTQKLGEVLVDLIVSERLKESVSGEQLYWLFRRLGAEIRLETKIRIHESGELKTIAEKLKER